MVPDRLKEGVQRYIQYRYQPGGFLTAVLQNNLVAAMNFADADNKANFTEVVKWVYDNTPEESRGSKEAVDRWLHRKEKS